MFQSFAPQPAFGQNSGTPLFGGAQNQPQGGVFGNQTQNSNPFSSQPQGGGIFGGNQQPANSQGGIFGNTATTGVFGGGNTQQQPSPFGGNTGNGIFGNTQGSNQQGVFGNTQNQGGGVFGNTQPQANTNVGFLGGGNKPSTPLFGGVTTPTNTGFGNTGTGQGVFGGNNQNSNQGGIFGGQNNQNQNTTGAFGFMNNNNNNSKPLFGGASNNNTPGVFGSGNTGGVFGNQGTPFGNAQGNTGGVFGGTPAFGGNNNNSGGIFGNTQQQGGGIFPNSNQTSAPFGNNQGGGVFGGTTANNQGQGVFGSQNNNQGAFGQNNQSGTLFNAGKGGVFGGSTNATQPAFSFGNNSTAFGGQTTTPAFGGNNNQNNFGNTSWGVPTGTNTQTAKFTPLKPKNAKIDNKHMIKCITLLDENMNFCKNQLRIRYIMTGGAQQNRPVGFGQSPSNTTAPLFGNSAPATGGAFGGSAFGQPTQPVATGGLFGGAPATGNPLFGGNPTASQPSAGFGLTGNTAPTTGFGLFGNTGANNNNMNTAFKPPGGGLFGNTNPTPQPAATGSLFGNTMATPTTNTGGFGLFGGQTQPQQPASGGLFGNTGGMFGNQGATQPTGSMFGASQPTGGMFGTTAATQPTGGLFGGSVAQPAQPQGSLFGGGSLFGNTSTPQPSFSFGQTSLAGGGGMFSTQPNNFGTTAGMFGGSTPQNNNNFTQFATSFINGLFNSDFFRKLITRDNNTPYDELKKQAANKYSSSVIDEAFKKYDDAQQQPLSYIPRYNKYHKSMYGSFNQSPYLNNDSEFDYISYHDDSENTIKAKQQRWARTINQEVQRLNERDSIISHESRLKNNIQFKGIPNRSKISVLDRELPVLDGYQITPSLDDLKNRSVEELKRVSGVTIENQFGKVKFKTPINLYKKKVSDCILIKENSIDIKDQEWENSRCELFFYNFGRYQELTSAERTKMEKKMRRWIEKHGRMREKNFDRQTGELHVEIKPLD